MLNESNGEPDLDRLCVAERVAGKGRDSVTTPAMAGKVPVMNVIVRIPDDLAERLAAAGGDLERRALENGEGEQQPAKEADAKDDECWSENNHGGGSRELEI